RRAKSLSDVGMIAWMEIYLGQWLVLDRIPMRQPTLISGEGAIGKSILLLQLQAAGVLSVSHAPAPLYRAGPRCQRQQEPDLCTSQVRRTPGSQERQIHHAAWRHGGRVAIRGACTAGEAGRVH